MSELPYETLEVRLAATGADLMPAVEAAQYAHLISHDPPQDGAEQRAIAGFIDAFTACVEAWEELDAPARAGTLAGLATQIGALERCGLFVHWGEARRQVDPASPLTIPVVFLTITRTAQAVARAMVPRDLGIGADPARRIN